MKFILGYLEAVLIQLGAYALISYIINRKKSFGEGYGLFIVISSIFGSIYAWSLLADYLFALEWYENLFWLFQIPVFLSTLLLVIPSGFVFFAVFFIFHNNYFWF